MNSAFELRHFDGSPRCADWQEWIYLEYGHDRNDSRCMGGAWYYRGDRAQALAQLDIYKQEQQRRAAAYYSQPWV